MIAALYDQTTGKVRVIIRTKRQATIDENLRAGESYMTEGVTAQTVAIEGGVPIDKADFAGDFDKEEIVADGADLATLTGLPDPCDIIVDGIRHQITGGLLEFSADTPGAYPIQLMDYRFFEKEWTIVAT